MSPLGLAVSGLSDHKTHGDITIPTIIIAHGFFLHRLGNQISFDEERLVQAKDAMIKGEDFYDIYDPRNPLNMRRREQDHPPPQKKQKTSTT